LLVAPKTTGKRKRRGKEYHMRKDKWGVAMGKQEQQQQGGHKYLKKGRSKNGGATTGRE
jgi:hypothetical protein